MISSHSFGLQRVSRACVVEPCRIAPPFRLKSDGKGFSRLFYITS